MEPPQSDRLPGACRWRRALTTQLLACFDRWGYAPVAPPALESYELLARGLSEEDRRACVRFVAPPDGRLLALRADVTPQIARMLAQRLGGSLPTDSVMRVSYAAEVVRHPAGPSDRAEIHQVGVELVGDAHAQADAELVRLCHEALNDLGLTGYRVDLSHPGIAAAMLDALGLPGSLRAEVRTKIAHKDRDGLVGLLASRPESSPADIEAVASLCDRFGSPSLLSGAAATLPAASLPLARLTAIVDAVTTSCDAPLSVDLGEVRGDSYYTGLRLRVWAPGVSRPIVRGGRYDDLLGRYGVSTPATGLAIDLDALAQALEYGRGAARFSERRPLRLVAVLPGEGAHDVDARRRRASEVASAARVDGDAAWVQPVLDVARATALADLDGVEFITLVGKTADRAIFKQDGRWVGLPPKDREDS